MHCAGSVFAALLLVSHSVMGLMTPEDIASSFSLTVSTSLPSPTAILDPSKADSFLISSWSLHKNKIQDDPEDLAFVTDPFPSSIAGANSSGPVLQATYPAGSYSGTGGGAQFFSLFNGSISPQTMLLSYEVAFNKGFQWVKGGKLPGLRGGPDTNGCEGGSEPNGTDCWSTRLMWRENGEGEAYAYIPTPNGLCSRSGIICNSDFGTSIDRGSFSFQDGMWNRITLLVQLNNPEDVANGVVELYYNDVQAILQNNLQLRSSPNVLAGGLFFSTFFGGSDSSWASPSDQQTFYRNFRLWASDRPSTATGMKVSGAQCLHTHKALWLVVGGLILTVGALI